MEGSVRVGFVGTGAIAAEHVRRLGQVPEADIVALCDVSRSRIEVVTTDLVNGTPGREPPAAYTDFERMFQRERLDAVFVCLPPHVRGGAERAAIRAGAALFVEKPVALRLDIADSVLRSADSAETITASGYQNRYSSEAARARDLLVGRRVAMATAVRFARPPSLSWYYRQALSGGQVIEMATHQVDLLRFLVTEVEMVYAAAARRGDLPDDGDIFDVNCSALHFADGAVGSLLTNVVSGHGKPRFLRGVHVVADGLTISIHGVEDEPQTFIYTTAGGVTESCCEEDTMGLQDAAFVRAVATGDRSLIRSDYFNGLQTLAVTLANEESARSRRSVDVRQLLVAEAPFASARLDW